MAVSLKGVARRYLNITNSFSVTNAVFNTPRTGSVSLRTRLEELAREENSFRVSECIYGWTAAFEQTWSHVIVRINLEPDSGISNATMNNLRNAWQNTIQTTWSNAWGISRTGEGTCPLTFEVRWGNNSPHHTVRVRTGPARSDMTTWDTQDTGAVAAHEFGHMIGNPDEYTDSNCDDRNPVNTGTIMDNNSNNIPARLVRRFADNLSSNIVGL